MFYCVGIMASSPVILQCVAGPGPAALRKPSAAPVPCTRRAAASGQHRHLPSSGPSPLAPLRQRQPLRSFQNSRRRAGGCKVGFPNLTHVATDIQFCTNGVSQLKATQSQMTPYVVERKEGERQNPAVHASTGTECTLTSSRPFVTHRPTSPQCSNTWPISLFMRITCHLSLSQPPEACG